MDVEDGRHFENSIDDEIEAKDWQPRLAEALASAKSRLLEERHSKGSWAQEKVIPKEKDIIGGYQDILKSSEVLQFIVIICVFSFL